MKNNKNIEIFSIGGYSSWCYYKPFRTLFDCGEGFATHFRNKIFGVDKLLITHFHLDHVAGIPQLVSARASARGNKDKPLTIYYPSTTVKVDGKLGALKALCDWNKNVNWVGVYHEDFSLQLTNKHYIKAFKTNHTEESIGYVIYEKRSRLRREYTNRNPYELKTLVRDGVQINEPYEQAVFVYALDNCGFDLDINSCDWFIQDANFLNSNDRERNTHNTLDEAIKKAKSIDAKNTILAHVSSRYFQENKSVNIPSNMYLLNSPTKYQF